MKSKRLTFDNEPFTRRVNEDQTKNKFSLYSTTGESEQISIMKILTPVAGIIIFLKCCGLWPNHQKYYIAYMTYAIIFQFIFTFCYTIFKCVNLYFLTEVTLITKTLFLCLGEVAFFFKVFNFHFYNKQIQQLLVDIKEFKLRSPIEETLLQSRLVLFSKIASCYVGCAGIAIFFSLVSPVFSEERVLPLAHSFKNTFSLKIC